MSDHRRWEDDLAVYALGALDPGEQAQVERHLATCAECRAALADLRVATDALPRSAPPVPAPAALKRRIMSVVESEAELLRAAGARADQPAETPAPGAPVRRRWLGGPRPLPVLAAAASLVLLAGVAGYVLRGAQDTGPRERAAVVRVPGAKATLQVRHDHGTLVVRNLPDPPPGRVYQVWLQRDGQDPRATRALFKVRSGAVEVPGSLRDVDQVLVSAEPPSGSVAPTRAPIIAAQTA
ncbi:MAG TPA: anti-sigma factor [Solirubrobacteraceae bacterium]|nr:anti-sigma factor [Solirubrobacteraceae bacterium]